MNRTSMYSRLKSFGATLAVSFLVLTPVWADDTEIFTVEIRDAESQPNLLFVIDTSGSMSSTVDDGQGKDRLEHVQEAFVNLLNNLTNVNVGLMRFSNPGGPILYPVSDLDAEVTQITNSTVTARVSSNDDDAQELSAGEMLVDEDYLSLVEFPGGVSYFEDTVELDSDDAEERASDGRIWLDSSQLWMRGGGYDSDERYLFGLHFRGSDVPADATITSASIRFTGVASSRANSTRAEHAIYGEKVDSSPNSPGFSSSDHDVSRRELTSASGNLIIEDDLYSGEEVYTDDLTAVVQEIIDQPGWQTTEDDMTFVMVPSGSLRGARQLRARDGSSGVEQRPTLLIQYYPGDTPPTGDTAETGLVFRNLNIPKGVDVTSAYIEFVASADATGAQSLTVVAENSVAPGSYTSAANNLSGRSYTSVDSAVSWELTDDLDAGDTFRTPDLSSLVEAVSGHDDWCGGSDMAFKISGDEGLRSVYAHEGDSSQSARLVVNYDPATIPEGTSCYQGVAVQRTAAQMDDVQESGSSVYTNYGSLDIQAGRLIGLRFPDLGIPQEARITNAYIELTQAYESDSGSITMHLAVEDNTNPAEFTGEDGTVDDRTFINSQSWSFSSTWYQNETFRLDGIASMIQPIINDANWQAGNALAFEVTASGSRDRNVWSNDGSPAQSPKLVVEYVANGSGTLRRTVREEMISAVRNLSHAGWTPVQDTMYEAAQYFTGGKVTWGAKRGGPPESGPHAYTRVSHPASMVPGTFDINYPDGCSPYDLDAEACRYQTIEGVGGDAYYESPMVDACETENHIILLTDGYANKDHSTSLIKDFIDSGSCEDDGTAGGDGGRCVQDLVKYLYDTDLAPFEGKQNIITNTVGFDFDDPWLAEVAAVSGGEYRNVGSADALEFFVEGLVTAVQKTNNTFVAPVAAVNQFNRLNHLSNIYFAVFRPDKAPFWPGNLKKYELGENNIVLGKDGSPAVDTDTGFFLDDSVDLWDPQTDDPNAPVGDPNNPEIGAPVEKGGAASNIPGWADDQRRVFTYHSGSSSRALSSTSNQLSLANVDSGVITKEMFDATSLTNTQFEQLVKWVRGADVEVDGEPQRYSFNDPLHSRPVAVTYNVSEDNPDVTVYVGTNGGSLQAVNASNGAELWAFFPGATLPLQRKLMENNPALGHLYGIDGTIVPWVSDNKADGIDLSDDKDFVRLFFGMRRGGSNYYAMDVTNRASPQVDWVLRGGSGAFSEMGQSWGTPIVGKIRLPGEDDPRDVLFISGGYDIDKDNETVRSADNVGRAVYIVDAVTGKRLWSASPHATSTSFSESTGYNQQFSDMQYSIPSGLTVADVNADGLDDLILVGDTGGQVWRFDITHGKPWVEPTGDDDEPGQFVRGAVIADLGVSDGLNVEARNRRFYHAPDVALVERGGERELAITIGSGYRAHPLNDQVHDRFYMLRQATVFGPPPSYETIVESDLYNATDNRVADGVRVGDDDNDVALDDEEFEAEEQTLVGKKGWYLDLHNPDVPGEKVLSTPITFRDRVVFVSYTPSPPDADIERNCKPLGAGYSRVYYMYLENAAPVKNWQDAENAGEYCEGKDCDENDRYFQLDTPSIIDEPVVICTTEGCDIFTGAEKPPIDSLQGDRIRKTYWRKDN